MVTSRLVGAVHRPCSASDLRRLFATVTVGQNGTGGSAGARADASFARRAAGSLERLIARHAACRRGSALRSNSCCPHTAGLPPLRACGEASGGSCCRAHLAVSRGAAACRHRSLPDAPCLGGRLQIRLSGLLALSAQAAPRCADADNLDGGPRPRGGAGAGPAAVEAPERSAR